MFRTDYDISDNEWNKLDRKFVKELHRFVRKSNILFEFTAFYIAKGLELNALWEGNFDGFINAAFDSLAEVPIKNKRKLKKLLKKKYSLVVTCEKPLKIKRIKKEPSN